PAAQAYRLNSVRKGPDVSIRVIEFALARRPAAASLLEQATLTRIVFVSGEIEDAPVSCFKADSEFSEDGPAGTRGLRPRPNRFFLTFSMSRSRPLSMMLARSPSGTLWQRRARASQILSRSSREAVNWTANVSALSGDRTDRGAPWPRGIATLCGRSTPDGGGPAAQAGAADPVPEDAACTAAAKQKFAVSGVKGGIGVPGGGMLGMGDQLGTAHSGTLRIPVRIGGDGARRATSSSIIRLDLCAACGSTTS